MPGILQYRAFYKDGKEAQMNNFCYQIIDGQLYKIIIDEKSIITMNTVELYIKCISAIR